MSETTPEPVEGDDTMELEPDESGEFVDAEDFIAAPTEEEAAEGQAAGETVNPDDDYDADLDDPDDDTTGIEDDSDAEGDDATDIEPESDDE